jgi:serine O-acetyltransferase
MCFLEMSKIWDKIICEVSVSLKKEPILSDFYYNSILQHKNLKSSLSYILANKLSTSIVSEKKIQKIFYNIYFNNSFILNFVIQDMKAILKRDPAVKDYLTLLLYLKGFHALEAYRLSHYLWQIKNTSLSKYLQNRISSESVSYTHLTLPTTR